MQRAAKEQTMRSRTGEQHAWLGSPRGTSLHGRGGRVDSAGRTCCTLSSTPASYPSSVTLRNCRELPDTLVKNILWKKQFPKLLPYCSLELQPLPSTPVLTPVPPTRNQFWEQNSKSKTSDCVNMQRQRNTAFGSTHLITWVIQALAITARGLCANQGAGSPPICMDKYKN